MTHSTISRTTLIGLAAAAALSLPACGGGKAPSGPGQPGQPTDRPPPIPGGPPRPALPAGWREFQHPEEGYKIYVPAQPQRDPRLPPSLRIKESVRPGDLRESIYRVQATEKQPFACLLHVTLFPAQDQTTYAQSYNVRPPDNASRKVTAWGPVTWAGRGAMEGVIEQTVSVRPNEPPVRTYSVGRYLVVPGRLYQFSIERTDRVPSREEQAAFFDSFVPGA